LLNNAPPRTRNDIHGTPIRILLVEDSEDDALLLLHTLRQGGYEPAFERVETREGMKSALENRCGMW